MEEYDKFEGIRLRNTQKGFTWDISIIGFDIDKLEKINTELKKRFSEIKWGED